MVKNSSIRFVSPRQWERIEQWSRRKPVFALMGEFSAGKSTLMNFLLRKRALPTQVTATQLPPVWFSWGNQPAYVKRPDGSTEEISLDQLDQVGVNDAQFIRIHLEADILEAVDLIDTPGISDPKISSDVWERAVGQANGVLWCTHSTQAWRETERATWVSLPERLHNNSLLLVTRADALNTKDRQKVLRRVNREAGHLFNRSILFSARDAITARDKTGDAELWARSGGGKMIDSFLEITEGIMDARADQLARYQVDKSLSDATPIQPMRTAEKSAPISDDSVAASEQSAEKSVQPLKLENPLQEGKSATASSGESGTVTNFPVRPARVAPRGDEEAERVERVRIDAEDAVRMRAEVTTETTVEVVPETETSDEDLRAFFRDTGGNPLDISSPDGGRPTESPLDMEDEFGLIDFDDEEEAGEEPSTLVGDTAEDLSEEHDAGNDTDALLASLNDQLEQTPDSETGDIEPDKNPAASEIEVSVSSITALLSRQEAAQNESLGVDFEPESEEGDLPGASVLAMSDNLSNTEGEPADADAEGDEGELEHLLDVPAGSPLSAAAMWREVASTEVLPDDAQDLRAVFQSFLEEFDKIAVEHSARQAKDTLRPIPKANNAGKAEWHVL